MRATALILLALLGAGAAAQTEGPGEVTLIGTVFDTDGNPAQGLQAIVVNADGPGQYVSSPSDESGEYVVVVPAGSRYRVGAFVTPGGQRLIVRPAPPTPARVPGSYRLPDVSFAAVEEDRDREPIFIGGRRPWYQRPGGVVGLAAGGAAVLLIAADGGSETASPSSP